MIMINRFIKEDVNDDHDDDGDDDDNDDKVSSLIQRIFAAPVLCRVLTGAISRTMGVKPHKKAHKNRPSYSEVNSVINLFALRELHFYTL